MDTINNTMTTDIYYYYYRIEYGCVKCVKNNERGIVEGYQGRLSFPICSWYLHHCHPRWSTTKLLQQYRYVCSRTNTTASTQQHHSSGNTNQATRTRRHEPSYSHHSRREAGNPHHVYSTSLPMEVRPRYLTAYKSLGGQP